MPDMSLCGTHRAKIPFIGMLFKSHPQTVDLDRVSEFCPGSVGLDIADGFRIDSGVFPGVQDHLGLASGAGRGYGRRIASMVYRRSLDYRVDPVSIPKGATQGLQKDRGHAFPRHVAIGGGIETVAASSGGQSP